MYLEEHFFSEFLKRGKQVSQYLIPVFWTNCYLQNETAGLQELLDTLNPHFQYFCVSQHDDAINEKLPPNTLHFNASRTSATKALCSAKMKRRAQLRFSRNFSYRIDLIRICRIMSSSLRLIKEI